MTDDRAKLADLLPLGFTARDPHRDVHAAADAILGSDWLRGYVATHAEAAVARFKAEAVAAIEAVNTPHYMGPKRDAYEDAASIVRDLTPSDP